MIEPERTALVLLAAGRSERFGDIDKLAQEFLHKPLAFHVVTALEQVPFLTRIAVVDGSDLDFAGRGYAVIRNDPTAEMAQSIRLGVVRAEEAGAQAVLIAMADMPRVTAAHIHRLLDAADGEGAVVASSNGEHPCPPALFGRERFAFLKDLPDRHEIRALVRAGRHVVTAPAELIDIDTPEDLEQLRSIAHAPHENGAITRPVAQ